MRTVLPFAIAIITTGDRTVEWHTLALDTLASLSNSDSSSKFPDGLREVFSTHLSMSLKDDDLLRIVDYFLKLRPKCLEYILMETQTEKLCAAVHNATPMTDGALSGLLKATSVADTMQGLCLELHTKSNNTS